MFGLFEDQESDRPLKIVAVEMHEEIEQLLKQRNEQHC